MALIHCPECNAQMSDQAPACPHCGMPNRTAQQMEVAVRHGQVVSSELAAAVGRGDPRCQRCLRKGAEVALAPHVVRRMSPGLSALAWLLLIFDLIGMFTMGLGGLGIIIALLLWGLARKDRPALRCPQCGSIRQLPESVPMWSHRQ